MNWLAVNDSVESFFEGNWSETLVSYNNTRFTKDEVSEWIRVSIIPGEVNQVTFGSSTNKYKAAGVASIQIFVKMNIGMSRALKLASQVSSLLINRVLDSVVFFTPQTVAVGASDGWFQVNVNCSFTQHVDM